MMRREEEKKKRLIVEEARENRRLRGACNAHGPTEQPELGFKWLVNQLRVA